ncbi:MAG TPA: hypothetical protein VJL82_06625 [Rhizomicrobium sp.]|nr:hypothetical protein [Rhizomicrobium sp.]
MTKMKAKEEFDAPTTVIADYLRKTISISYLMGLVWAGRLIVAAAAALGFFYGIYAVYHAGPSYTATMRVSPAASDSSLGEAAGMGGLLAGLNGGTGATQVPRFIQFTYALGSVEVAQALDRKYDLLCRIYSGDCDPVTHRWKTRTGLKEWLTGLAARLSGLPDPNVGPRTAIDLASYIASQVIVTQLKKTDSVIALTYVNRNPDFAARFLSEVVETTDDYVRTQSRETQRRYVEYLSKSAAKATNVEQRQAIDAVLLQEERQLMMTEVDVPYAARILDGPTVTPVNNALKKIATCAILGLFLGLLVALSRDFLPRKWRIW